MALNESLNALKAELKRWFLAARQIAPDWVDFDREAEIILDIIREHTAAQGDVVALLNRIHEIARDEASDIACGHILEITTDAITAMEESGINRLPDSPDPTHSDVVAVPRVLLSNCKYLLANNAFDGDDRAKALVNRLHQIMGNPAISPALGDSGHRDGGEIPPHGGTSEISVVGDNFLQTKIFNAISNTAMGSVRDCSLSGLLVSQKIRLTDSILEAIRPYLRTREPVAAGEIPDINYLERKLDDLLFNWRMSEDESRNDVRRHIIDLFHPYLTAREPVMVSLEKCAKALHDCRLPHSNWDEYKSWNNSSVYEDQAKAVLDAAGVAYVD